MLALITFYRFCHQVLRNFKILSKFMVIKVVIFLNVVCVTGGPPAWPGATPALTPRREGRPGCTGPRAQPNVRVQLLGCQRHFAVRQWPDARTASVPHHGMKNFLLFDGHHRTGARQPLARC